ncbi:MAG: hypothetical protein NC203_08070 [Firmicutes bacterium]|nr:hypothetical protein [[Eubacterium] siraeum]MCM1488305.1 hypothetical protein [Bacillota bacterium]
MTEENLKLLTTNFGEIEKYLEQYIDATSLLMQIDSEENDKITEQVNQREKLIGEIDFLTKQCRETINSLDKEECAQVKKMLNEDTASVNANGAMAILRNSILNLKLVQEQAAAKDKDLVAQFSSRMNEAKDKLSDLTSGKKKAEYFSSTVPTVNNVGSNFDSNF